MVQQKQAMGIMKETEEKLRLFKEQEEAVKKEMESLKCLSNEQK